jgi:myo-inositol-1-phosphate synthase
MPEIRVALVGVGNCASALVQGVHYYGGVSASDPPVPGLMHNRLGNYLPRDIRFVAAFDIDRRKVGKDLGEAIFEKPNCTAVFFKDVPRLGVIVRKGPPLDGVAPHMATFPPERTFCVDDRQPVADVVAELKRSGAEILLNYLPVGSSRAVQFYAEAALEAGCAFVNCMPAFVASDKGWAGRFEERRLPVAGDDVKGQLGATIVHRALARLFSERGVKVASTYQLNVGGNTDFLNMLARDRLAAKRISKTDAVQSQMDQPLGWEQVHIGPSDYVAWLNDQKVCFIRMEGRKFGGAPVHLELRLSVEDSPNSAGCVIDMVRGTKLALDRKVSGALISMPAYLMKHPPQQFPDHVARQMCEEFIRGERER